MKFQTNGTRLVDETFDSQVQIEKPQTRRTATSIRREERAKKKKKEKNLKVNPRNSRPKIATKCHLLLVVVSKSVKMDQFFPVRY